ncbi:MAG: hypothetical protein ACXVBW_12070, partial [Bdellovibrionota bacterium]
LPLFFSHGLASGAAVSIALLNFAAIVWLWRIYCLLFPSHDQLSSAIFLLFAPWTYLYTDICNTSYILILAVWYYWCLLRLFERPKDFWASFGLAVSVALLLQIHLSAVVLIALTITLWAARILKTPKLSAFLAGAALGGATLIPYYLWEVRHQKPFLSSNIEFQWWHFQKQYKIFFRFVSFPSGETARFFGGAGGFPAALRYIGDTPWLWIPFVIGYPVSIAISLLGVRFFLFRKETWTPLIRQLRTFVKRSAPPRLTAAGTLELTMLLGLLITMAQFLVAIKEPSAHTFLVLLPVSFYPVYYYTKNRKIPRWAVALYALCVTMYSVGAYVSLCPFSVLATDRAAIESAQGRAVTNPSRANPDALPLVTRTYSGAR